MLYILKNILFSLLGQENNDNQKKFQTETTRRPTRNKLKKKHINESKYITQRYHILLSFVNKVSKCKNVGAGNKSPSIIFMDISRQKI